MSRYRKKSKKAIIFQQDFGNIFGDVMLVSAGGTPTEVLAYATKHRFRKDLLAYIATEKDVFDLKGDLGRFAWATHVKGLFLVLGPYEDTWAFWEMLIHELNHAVFRFAEIKTMQTETEVQARLQEYLFRSIRRKLQNS